MSNLRAYIANCLIGGHLITKNGPSWIRDTVEFDIANRTFILKQNASVITGKLAERHGRFIETSEVLVKDVSPNELQNILATIHRLCWLLSFAGLSRVVCYGYDYPNDGTHSVRQAVAGTAEYFRPTLEINDGGLIKSFIEQTYATFIRLESSRKLSVVIDYLLQAERQHQPTECRLIFAFVLLENLKDTFARSEQIPFVDGHFKKTDGKSFHFKELLKRMFLDVGMTPDLTRAINLRNEIIHSGLSQRPHHELWRMYEEIHDLLREYILRLLGYRGSYLVYSLASNSTSII